MATNPFGTTYTEAKVTYYTPAGERLYETFPATGGVYYKEGAIQIESDDGQLTIIPLNDIVGSVVLR